MSALGRRQIANQQRRDSYHAEVGSRQDESPPFLGYRGGDEPPAPWWEGLPVVIVTRHEGAVEWLRRRGIEGEVMAQVGPEDIRRKVVVGNLPLWLCQFAAGVGSIDLPLLRPEQRGRNLSAEEMDEAGASIKWYKVEQVSGPII